MATQRFSYSLYDKLGRVYEAGELEDAASAPYRFQDLPATDVNGDLLPNVLDPDVLKAWVLNRPRHEVTRTYYDDIFPSLSIPGFAQVNLRLRVASTVFYESEYAQPTPNEANYDHATHYSYDIHGNVKTLVQDHPQLGIDGGAIQTNCTGCVEHRYKRMDYTYDLISGNVRQVDYQKDQPDALHHRYTYDADNRITDVETSADAQNWHTDARYFYYPHGPLQRVELGEHLVQGTDYAYTLQGWLKGINGDRLNPTTDMGRDGDATVVGNPNLLTGRDAYALSLGYYGDGDYKAIASAYDSDIPANVVQRPFAPMGTSGTLNTEHTPLYNGNIAHTVNTLQHFGLWDATNGDQGQVLAMVYRYDQLNRLRTARGLVGLGNTNTWNGVNDAGPNEDNRYRSEYEYDANGNILTANRWDYEGDHYDQFAYKYQRQSGTARLLRNRLYQLFDEADPMNLHANPSPDGSEDIGYLPETTTFDEQAAELNGLHNYHYDALGNLIHDAREQIDVIEWTVAGKVKSVSRTLGSTRDPLSFGYGASGQRILKQVGTNPDGGNGYREHYIRDAQGNIMATYRYTNNAGASLKLNERPLYGSSRLGSLRKEVELHTLSAFDPASANPVQQVDLNYELTDHLGNVCAVVTGRLLDGNGGGTAKQAELVSAQGYEPFGSLLPGRNFSSSFYDYGFNGKRKDDEILGATGTSYDFGARLFDPRVSRWLKMDPQAGAYPGHSPYCFVLNTPIRAIDPDGEWVYFVICTGGNPQAFDVAQTRIKEIQGSKDFDPQRDHVYFLEVSDLGTLSDQIAKCVQDAHQNGYGLTVEASFFGHAAGDGPVGASVTSRNSLAGVTGNNNPINGDQKQLSPAGWMEVDFNFDPSGSVANFYGCNTAEFAERFITYQPDVSYASGIGGGAGPSYTFEGSFSHVLWNIFGSPEYYADKDENGNVGARFVYSRDTYRPSEGPSGYMDAGKNWIQYRQESFIYGNVGINNSNGCPENQSGQ